MLFVSETLAKSGLALLNRILSHLSKPLETLTSLGPVLPLLRAATWVKLGKSCSYTFLEMSLMTDSDNDHAALSAAHIAYDSPVTALYLEARISVALAVQGLRSCNAARSSGMMGRDCQTWMLRRMETISWDNFHYILQL